MSVHAHPWRMRFLVTLVMILLSFIGLIVTDLQHQGSWIYWMCMVPIFAALCLWLSWYIRNKTEVLRFTSIWHELLHWVAMGGAGYVVAMYVDFGILGRFEAGLVILILLALTTFIAGIYTEKSLMVIGVLLGFFAIGAGFIEEYLYSIMLPITIAVAVILFFIIRYRKVKKKENRDEVTSSTSNKKTDS